MADITNDKLNHVKDTFTDGDVQPNNDLNTVDSSADPGDGQKSDVPTSTSTDGDRVDQRGPNNETEPRKAQSQAVEDVAVSRSPEPKKEKEDKTDANVVKEPSKPSPRELQLLSDLDWYKWFSIRLPIAVASICVVIVACLVAYTVSLQGQLSELQEKRMEWVKLSGRYEERMALCNERDDKSNRTTTSLVKTSDRVLGMLERIQESVLIGRGVAEKEKDKCHNKLEHLHIQINNLKGNITTLVEERERYYHRSQSFSDRLEHCELQVRDCLEQKRKCWC